MSEPLEANDGAPTPRRRWYGRVGPGLITACVVIGPGSILTSSKIGAEHGFSMLWVVVVAVLFMMVYTTLGAKLGVVVAESPGNLITQRAGRWLAVLIGCGVFFISAAFQFGNNLGVHSAFGVFLDLDASFLLVSTTPQSGGAPTEWKIDFGYLVVFFNLLAIGFLFVFRNLYRALERLMMMFVALMLLSFAANLIFARPSLGELVRGFVPAVPADMSLDDLVLMIGLVGTTFVITASFFQAYLVRQKGWGRGELREGIADARVGAVLMLLITLMIMSTSAASLRGQELANVGDVANQLKPLFGVWGQAFFCTGLFCAAYSSFLVNSMIGGFILSDGLGLGSDPRDLAPRLLTTAVLLTGMGVALYVIKTGWEPVPAIVAAQAVTVVAAPLMAGALLWLTSRADIMGEDRNGILTKLVAGIGFLMILAMAVTVAGFKVWPAVRAWMGSS